MNILFRLFICVSRNLVNWEMFRLAMGELQQARETIKKARGEE